MREGGEDSLRGIVSETVEFDLGRIRRLSLSDLEAQLVADVVHVARLVANGALALHWLRDALDDLDEGRKTT